MSKINHKKLSKKCQDENVFYVCNGSVLSSINELLSELENMDEDAFRHHVNESKNDFSNWIHDIFREADLADKIRNVTDKNEAVEIIKSSFAPTRGKSNKKK